MNKIQFLVLFITIIPLFSAFIVIFMKNKTASISKFTIILALIMIANIINLFFSYDGNLNAISLFKITQDIDIGFSVTNISLIIALIVTFIWLIITIYSNEYFTFIDDNRFFAFKLSSIILVEFIILIIFSKNLISLFIFYQCLIFFLYFFNSHFMDENDFGATNHFTLSLLTSSFFLFLATILTYQTAGNTEFSNIGILQDLSFKRYFALLVLFIFAIASIALLPIHLFFKKLYHLNAPIIIMIFVISYGLVNLLILLKIILNIFGFEYFINYANKFNLSYILNFIIGLNLIISAFLALAQNNLKKILIFLFFNQLIFSFFLFLILNQTIDQFIITIISFISSQSLIFLCLGNINIYLLRAKEKSLAGIFFKLKNSSLLLFFGLFSLIGIVPSVGLIEKYIIVENYLISDFNLNLPVIFINIILVSICLIRVIYIITQKSGIDKNYDYELAKAVDRNGALIIPPFIIAILMFLFFVFFKYINNYLKLFLS